MIEEAAKNLWILITVVAPGLFTYGAWRLLLLLEPSKRLAPDAFKQIDDSTIASAAIIIAIALSQQAVAISIEALLTLVAKIKKTKWPNFYSLFCERFALAGEGKLTESSTRIIANFFLSINITIGLSFLLLYFFLYEKISADHWVSIGIAFVLLVSLVTTIFRMLNAKWMIEKCK
jgi:hypothetical protein